MNQTYSLHKQNNPPVLHPAALRSLTCCSIFDQGKSFLKQDGASGSNFNIWASSFSFSVMPFNHFTVIWTLKKDQCWHVWQPKHAPASTCVRRTPASAFCLLNAPSLLSMRGKLCASKMGWRKLKAGFFASFKSHQYTNAVVICPHCCLMKRQWSSLEQIIDFSLLHRGSQGS